MNLLPRLICPALATSLAGAIALLPARDARASGGPADEIKSWFNDPDPLAIVTGGVMMLGNLSLTTAAGIDTAARRESGRGFYITEGVVGAAQALAYAGSTVIYDAHQWTPWENLLIYFPATAWTTGLGVHGIWSAVSAKVEPPTRLGLSFVIGTNWAFTGALIGCYAHERLWSPAEMAIAEITFTSVESIVAIERAVDDPDHAVEWSLLAGWSSSIFLHGVLSAIAVTRDDYSREHARVERPRLRLEAAPYMTPIEGGAIVGLGGRL